MDSDRDGRCDIFEGSNAVWRLPGGGHVIMKQCSCGKDAWEGSQEIKEPSVKEEHLALDSQLVGVSSPQLGTTADKYQDKYQVLLQKDALV